MQRGWVRIIAGKWRGRQLRIPRVHGVRPTPDRVRETLFNWLASHVRGASCLDLFAGSGVLGLEALSRGAAYAMMVDQSSTIVALLRENLLMLNAQNADVYHAVLPRQLHRVTKRCFDIVFLDPPYQANLLLPCCAYLEEQGWLAEIAHIYLEAPHVIENNQLPLHWRILKYQQAGQVVYHLARRERVTT
jgi:16S rRNA (guanine966-N2)-methyltransferase